MNRKRAAIAVGVAVLVLVAAWFGWSRFGSKSWWVYGANVDEMGKGYMFSLGIASRNNSLIESLENDMWEIRPGPDCNQDAAMVVTFPSFVNSHEDECSYPHRTIKVVVIPEDGKIESALESAIRVKGESTWVKLSDVIEVGEDGRSIKVL